MTKSIIQKFGREVLPHPPPYLPDLAPSDFHLFLSLFNALRGVTFNTYVELRAWLDEFFSSKPGDFHHQGIEKFCDRWEKLTAREIILLINFM